MLYNGVNPSLECLFLSFEIYFEQTRFYFAQLCSELKVNNKIQLITVFKKGTFKILIKRNI